jgi:hypothetical protein
MPFYVGVTDPAHSSGTRLGQHPARDQLKNPEYPPLKLHDRNTVGFNENAGGIA